MAKKVIISESDFKKIVRASIIEEANLSDADIDKKVKSAVSSALKDNKEIEKKLEKEVKKIVAKSLDNLFKTLWQRSNFWQNAIN